MSNPPFKVGDKVRHRNGVTEFLVSEVLVEGTVFFLKTWMHGGWVNQGWDISDNYVLVEQPKHYFVNDNRTLMTEEEAMEYLRKNGGGTLYKRVLTMTTETKTVEKIERYE